MTMTTTESRSGLKNSDNTIHTLEQLLADVARVSPAALKSLLDSSATVNDDYLNEQIYRTLCTIHLEQENIEAFENVVGRWLRSGTMTLHSALWLAPILRVLQRPYMALEVLLPFADSEWRTKSGFIRLQWIELLLQVIRDLDDLFTAAEVCEKLVALYATLEKSESWLSDTDLTSTATFYAFLADLYLSLSRITDEYDKQIIEYSELQKAAFFSRGLESIPYQLLSEHDRRTYLSLVQRLAELEAASMESYQQSLARNPFRGRLLGQQRAIEGSNIIVAASDFDAEHEREREIASVREELFNLRSHFPPRAIASSTLRVGKESIYEQIAGMHPSKKAVSLVYRIDQAEERVLIFLLDSSGNHQRIVADINISSLEALIFMLDQHPLNEFDYIISSLSEMLVPEELRERLLEFEGESLLVSADAQLSGVPWEALGKGEWRLGTCFALTNTPSLLTPCRLVERSAKPAIEMSHVEIIADPTGDLPGALDEGIEIQRLLEEHGVSGNLNTPCSASQFLKIIEQCSFVHFAGHTHFSRNDPASSCLLVQDHPITALEIAAANIEGTVTLLSSCSSGRGGQPQDIENPFGICNAFLLGGSTAVIATNWLADDESSTWLMASLYRALMEGETDPLAETLRRFRKDLFEKHEPIMNWAIYSVWGHPYVTLRRNEI